MSSSTVIRFASIFSGRTDVWGALHGEAVKERVVETHYSQHLEGEVSLGVYPLNVDGKIRWCAIDIDKKDIDLGLAGVECLAGIGMTSGVYLERSKGKGFHVLVLFSDWVPATYARKIMKFTLHEAGLPDTTEIFPKQDRLTKDTPWGNYLNLPYFGDGTPEGKRMVLDLDTLEPIPLMSWLERVNTFPTADLALVCSRLPSYDPLHLTPTKRKTVFRELLSTVHTTGSRRPTLVSVVGHLRSRGVSEDVAVLLVVPWAKSHFNPSLPDAEVEKHIQGIYRRYGVAGVTARRPKSHAILPTIEV